MTEPAELGFQGLPRETREALGRALAERDDRHGRGDVLRRAATRMRATANGMSAEMQTRRSQWASGYRVEIDGALGGQAGVFAREWTPEVARIVADMLAVAADNIDMSHPHSKVTMLASDLAREYLNEPDVSTLISELESTPLGKAQLDLARAELKLSRIREMCDEAASDRQSNGTIWRSAIQKVLDS